MQKSILHIFWVLLLCGGISVFYFFSLLLHVPVWITLIFCIAAGVLLWKGIGRLAVQEAPLDSRMHVLAMVAFAGGLFLLVNRGYYLSEKYGQWDAWALWNQHALFLQDSAHWKNYLSPLVDTHPDYPLCLSALIAFFWRLFHNTSYMVPFAVSAIVSISIPAIIFLDLYRKNLLIATLLLLWFATDDFYITRSLSQYADHLLALFFLCGFVCMDHFRKSGKESLMLPAGAFAGLCMWTKNEGAMLAFIFILFHLDYLRRPAAALHFLTGFAIPVAALLVFKLCYAPTNDLLALSGNYLSLLTDQHRYHIIFDALRTNGKAFFQVHEYVFLLYLFVWVVNRKLPFRNMCILLVCVTGFISVYLLTPQDIEWHIETSMSRVLAQLAPVFVYTAGIRFADLH